MLLLASVEVANMLKFAEWGRFAGACPRLVVMVVLAVACAPAPAPVTPAQVMDAEFVLIRSGTFQMGDVEDKDAGVHTVTLTRSFLMQTGKVTQGEWVAVMGRNPSYFSDCGSRCPVDNVSYENVQAFIARLNQLSPEKHFRLATEAEWEYAERAGTTFAGAWRTSDSTTNGATTRDIRLQPNDWGLYYGGGLEWVNDWIGPDSRDAATDPTGPVSGARRVVRGGWWAGREAAFPADRTFGVGPGFTFRLARTL
jgi:formylglycine-generating enzyme required for sulfatase activity